MSTRLAVGVIGQNIVIDCGTHEEAIRLCETIASVITGREALPTDVPILRLTGEQMGSIDPPLSEDWFCDFDEYEEFVPLRALAEREARWTGSVKSWTSRLATAMVEEGFAVPAANRDEQWDAPVEEAERIVRKLRLAEREALDVERMREAARRAGLPRNVSVQDIEDLAREYAALAETPKETR